MRQFAIVLAACLGVAAFEVTAQTPRPSDFALRLPLQLRADGLHVIEFPEAVYRAAQTRDLSDLRIFNASDEALPLAFVRASPPAPETSAAIDLQMAPLPQQAEARDTLLRSYALRVERDRERAVVEIEPKSTPAAATIGGYLIDARALKQRQGRLVLSFASGAADYAGRIELLGSDDLVNWRALTAGPLARSRRLGDVIERNQFELDRPPAFVRVAWTSTEAPLLDRAQFAEHLAPSGQLPRAVLAATLADDRRSLTVDVPEALPVTRVFMRVPELNRVLRARVYRHDAEPALRARTPAPRRHQDRWQPIGSIEGFRLLRDGVEVEGPALAMPLRTDRLRFDFAEQMAGDPPSVDAEWQPVRAVFVAKAPGPYRLAVGHPAAGAGPTLDVRSMLPPDDPTGARLPVATLDEASARLHLSPPRDSAEAQWRYALWALLALAVSGLAWMAWKLSSQLRAASAPEED